ncbi:hypothetical protein [Endozoicomonas sp. SESOKO1]|uniref:hypothetical protein n=1 Tax=Endozoicomonas sp. SESOKO1 TaxID=2828742 RepID=UPI002147DB84|nr:hypothetical protein [Endozoicomonas sp. SESOKO1]
MIGITGNSETLSGLYAVDGIDRSGHSRSSGFPVIGRRGGFAGFEIAGYERRGRSLTVPVGQDEQDNNKDLSGRNDIVNRSLRSRRIYPLQSFIRPYLFHPFLFRPLKLHRRCWPNSCSAHRPSFSSHCPQPRVAGDLFVFMHNGRITKGFLPVSRRWRPLKAKKREKSPVKKIARKENARQVGHGMIIGGKAIFPDSDLVFFQLCLDYYADYRKNTNHPARQGMPSQYDPLQRPSCGDHAMILYGEYNQNRVMDCPVGCSCRCCSEGAERHCRSPGKCPCFFNGAYSFGKDINSVFVMGRKFRFGLWNIKLLTALLIFFLLITFLEGITGIRGFVSIASLSALELLSGLVIALGMMAMALLVLCVLMKR